MEQQPKTVGSVRLEYLDGATKAYGTGDVGGTTTNIDMFLLTIKDMHPASEEIQKGFDQAMKNKESSLDEQKKEFDKLVSDQKINSWQHSEMMNNARVVGDIQEINEKLNELWQISLKHGLFNE